MPMVAGMPAQTALARPPALAALLSGGPVALFLDFDGTLVEIAPGPDAIAVPSGLDQQLCMLGERLGGRLALVTGRSLDNLGQHLGTPPIARAGSHGASRRMADGGMLGNDPPPLPDAVRSTLSAFAADSGVLVEAKPHGAALHYRADPAQEEHVEALASRVAGEHGLTIKRGKCVVELVTPGAGKDGAVRAFMARAPFAGAMPVFIGDDVTDEDGFRAAAEMGGWGIIVGDRASQSARYRLPKVQDVHAWLEL